MGNCSDVLQVKRDSIRVKNSTAQVRTINLRQKPWWIALAVVVLVMGMGATIAIEGGIGSGATLNGQVGIGNRIVWAAGYNGTTTEFAAMKVVGGTAKTGVYLNFTGFKPKEISIATGNTKYDVEGLMNSSNVYQFTDISVASTGAKTFTGKASLADAYSYVGKVVNGTNMAKESSHGVDSATIKQVLYTNTTNNLGKSIGYNLFALAATPVSDLQVYTLHLNYTTGNDTGVSVHFTNYMLNFGQNLYEDFSIGAILSAFGSFFILIWAFPRRR